MGGILMRGDPANMDERRKKTGWENVACGQFQQFVRHGLNGQNTKEEPIKPQKSCHNFLGKKNLLLFTKH